MKKWITLIISLPTENATARMRAWRALKASGAAVLHDGVYLLPDRPECRTGFSNITSDIQETGGSALLLEVKPPHTELFEPMFDRTGDYASLLDDIRRCHQGLSSANLAETQKQLRKLQKSLANLGEIDFFPGEAARQTTAAAQELQRAISMLLSPDEPQAIEAALPRLAIGDFQGRTWATRQRPWVDRLACAWLIRRHIDPQARLLWLASPADCPADALGFDFDGATFTHIGHRVSFEVLLASFDIKAPGLERLAALVHFLDVGGIPPAEAGGIEAVLAGLRASIADDDQLLAAASQIFDGLLASFAKGSTS